LTPPFGIIRCREASELQSLGRDGSLSPKRRVALLLHLAICVHCRRWGRQIGILGRAFRRATERDDLDGF
jgi:predicted anti-sigma-YlaC factor YlaD